MMWLITFSICGILSLTSGSQLDLPHLDNGQDSLLREIFAAVREDPSLLQPLHDEFVARGGEMPVISESYLVDNSSGCLGCIDVINQGNAFINQPGPGYPVWRLAIIRTCKLILDSRGVDGDLVCAGLCDNYGPHVFDIFRAREFEGRFVCEFLNNCDRPEVFEPPITVQRPEPSKHQKQRNVVVPDDSLKVAMVTDVHVEPRYAEGAATDCNIWVCCRDIISGTGSARYWGEYTCNTAPHTLQVFLDQVADLQPDVVLYGGDGPPHSLWDETQGNMLNMTSWIAKEFTERLSGISVFPTLGNHDGYPANLYYTPREDTQEQNVRFGEDWAVAAGLGPDELETIHYSGYYTKEVVPGLRIMAYNGNYGYTNDWYNLLSVFEDVIPTMAEWMEETLQTARLNDEKVILFSHFPLGNGDNIVENGQFMRELFIDYSDVITLQPVGHTHQAQIKLTIDDDGVATNMVYVTGSITPYTDSNPTITMFYLDPVTFEVLDFDQYYNHIDDQSPEVEPQLELLYRASEEYNLVDLSPASWLDLTYRFEDDDELWQSYLDNRNSQLNPGRICDTGCKHNTLCAMRSTDYVTYRRCVNDYVPE